MRRMHYLNRLQTKCPCFLLRIIFTVSVLYQSMSLSFFCSCVYPSPCPYKENQPQWWTGWIGIPRSSVHVWVPFLIIRGLNGIHGNKEIFYYSELFFFIFVCECSLSDPYCRLKWCSESQSSSNHKKLLQSIRCLDAFSKNSLKAQSNSTVSRPIMANSMRTHEQSIHCKKTNSYSSASLWILGSSNTLLTFEKYEGHLLCVFTRDVDRELVKNQYKSVKIPTGWDKKKKRIAIQFLNSLGHFDCDLDITTCS